MTRPLSASPSSVAHRFLRRAALLAASLTAAFASTMMVGCDPGSSYSQRTPEETITTAARMAQNNEAEFIVKLIYDEGDPNYNRFLNRLGYLLGHLQELANEVNRAFPEEVAKLKKDAEEQAKKAAGTTTGRNALAAFLGNQNSRGQRATGPQSRERRPGDERMSQALNQIFIDPFAFIEENSHRLTTAVIDDYSVALLWDKQPIIPGVPLVMTKPRSGPHTDRWYFALPLDMPALKGYVYKTDEGFKVYTSLVAVLDNIVKELRDDVRAGKAKNLQDLTRMAGEKAFIPLPMSILAIERLGAAERKAAKTARDAKAPTSPTPTPPN